MERNTNKTLNIFTIIIFIIIVFSFTIELKHKKLDPENNIPIEEWMLNDSTWGCERK